MLKKRRRGWKFWAGIVAGILVVLVVGGLLGWQALQSYFIRAYYDDSYAPIPLTEVKLADASDVAHLDDVPWIASSLPVCQSTSLQMIAAQHGIDAPRRYFDFLMGFTYGATNMAGAGFFPVGTDPEIGMATAAPYLGLARRYYVTDDADLYLYALRYFLAQGYPIRLAIDMGVLYGVNESIPHSEVLIGYDATGFYYYETVCISPASCEVGTRPPGQEGIHVTDQVILDAVLKQAKAFKYSWRYALTIFESAPVQEDLSAVWAQNGQSLVGGVPYVPTQGADAIEAFADQVETRWGKLAIDELIFAMTMAVQLRQDNATYLREAFPGDSDLIEAAACFDRASDAYAVALIYIEDGLDSESKAAQVATHLRTAAAAERQAGEIFLAQ